MRSVMKTNLLCTECGKPIQNNNAGMFVWGKDTKKNPFILVHKGNNCDLNREENIYSNEVDDILHRVNRKLTIREIRAIRNEMP